MTKLIASMAAVSMFVAASLPAFAATKSAEDTCKEKAKTEHIKSDKMESFMKSCVEKHPQSTTGTGGPQPMGTTGTGGDTMTGTPSSSSTPR